MQRTESLTLFDGIGGAATIRNLVEAFYPRVYADPDLRPLFPDGVDEIKEKQYLFLTQFTGGPTLYSDQSGPPNMRKRHEPFEITQRRAEAWLRCMKEAMDEIGMDGPARELLFHRLTHVAHAMVNTPDEAFV